MSRVLIVLTLLALIAAPAVTHASDLPPVDPSACTIAPVEIGAPEDAGDLNLPSPTPSPITTSEASAAGSEDVEAVKARIAQSIACMNAGDLPKMLANFSAAWIAARFTGYDLVFLERFFEAAASPSPLAPEDRIALVSIEEVRVRADGVALATVVTRQHDLETVSLIALIQEQGIWLIDGGEVRAAG